MTDYAGKLSSVALEIEANKIDPNHPFQWASGYWMPLYNDNRLLLGDYAHRKLSTEAFKQIIESRGIEYDMVAGTSTAGIAPAASLASMLKCPVTILEKGKVLSFDNDLNDSLVNECIKHELNYDIIASTSPYAIIPGVALANRMKLPFLYVRQKKKGHGMGKQIEGVSPKGKDVFIVDFHIGESYLDDAGKAIHEQGGFVCGYVKDDISGLIRTADVNGKRIVQVEDVVSTAGSCVKEIDEYCKRGAVIKHCLALYSYHFSKALDLFEESGISLDSAYSYDSLIRTAEETGRLSSEDKTLLDDWARDNFGWGERHGFPRVVKK